MSTFCKSTLVITSPRMTINSLFSTCISSTARNASPNERAPRTGTILTLTSGSRRRVCLKLVNLHALSLHGTVLKMLHNFVGMGSTDNKHFLYTRRHKKLHHVFNHRQIGERKQNLIAGYEYKYNKQHKWRTRGVSAVIGVNLRSKLSASNTAWSLCSVY